MAGAIYKVYRIISLPAENIRIYLSDKLETKIKDINLFTFSEGGVPDVYKLCPGTIDNHSFDMGKSTPIL